MEFLSLKKQIRTVFLVSEGIKDFSEFRNIIEKKYTLRILDSSMYSIKYINENMNEFSTIVMNSEKAAENDFEIFRFFESDSMLQAVPIIIYCDDFSEVKNAEKCIEQGATDIIYPPFSEDLLLYKFATAIRLKDAITYHEIEYMLKELPSNIYLKDSKGRYIFATHYWHHLEHNNDPYWSIRGKTDVDIRKDKENAKNALQADLEIFKTGKGTDYTIEINTDGKREFFEIIKYPLRDVKGNISGIVGLINDVTDRELLRISLEESAMMDELTHVYNRRCFEKFTSSLSKNCKYPVSIISADCNDLKKMNDTYGHLVGDEYIRMTTMLFRTDSILLNRGKIFRTGGDEFVILLPETTLKEAESIVENLKNEAHNLSIKQTYPSISYGVSCVESEKDDFKEFLDIADKKMYADKAEYKKRKAAAQNQ